MAAQMKIEVRGMKEVRAGMKACEQDLKDLTRANKALAKVAEADIREAVPSKSGKWRGAIKGGATRTAAKVVWGRASVPYAPWIEFGGTVAWKGRGGMTRANIATHGIVRTVAYMSIKRPRVASGRYVYPTAEANAEKYLEVYTDLLDETLRRNGFR
jgi:hypothetical protein